MGIRRTSESVYVVLLTGNNIFILNRMAQADFLRMRRELGGFSLYKMASKRAGSFYLVYCKSYLTLQQYHNYLG